MGLSELLKPLEVPKGPSITTFALKEAFGVAMLERHYAAYHQRLTELLQSGEGNYRDRILALLPANMNQFCQHGTISGCLTVKLSAGVCDLSEDMRSAMDKGCSRRDRPCSSPGAGKCPNENHCLTLCGEPLTTGDTKCFTHYGWVRICARKISAQFRATLENALAHVKTFIATPAFSRHFLSADDREPLCHLKTVFPTESGSDPGGKPLFLWHR